MYCSSVLGGCALDGELLTVLNTCIVLFVKSITTILLGDFASGRYFCCWVHRFENVLEFYLGF
jgi:hypothetical protein